MIWYEDFGRLRNVETVCYAVLVSVVITLIKNTPSYHLHFQWNAGKYYLHRCVSVHMQGEEMYPSPSHSASTGPMFFLGDAP